jgi:hypothetical protein
MINMTHVSPQLILSCVVGYYLLIKVAGRGLNATVDISTLREVAYLVATISVGSYLITNVFQQLLKNMPAPKLMYGVSEPIEEEEENENEKEDEEGEVVEEETETETKTDEEGGDETEEEAEVEEETEEEEEEEEDDSSDSDYVPPRSKRKLETLDSDNEFPCPL